MIDTTDGHSESRLGALQCVLGLAIAHPQGLKIEGDTGGDHLSDSLIQRHDSVLATAIEGDSSVFSVVEGISHKACEYSSWAHFDEGVNA